MWQEERDKKGCQIGDYNIEVSIYHCSTRKKISGHPLLCYATPREREREKRGIEKRAIKI